MPGRVTCNNCGGRVEVPAGHTRAKIRCTGCGYYTEVPPDLRDDEPAFDDEPTYEPLAEEHDDPEDRRSPVVSVRQARMVPDEPAGLDDDGPPLLAGTQEEDDDKPYAVPSDGTKACKKCYGRIPRSATFCTLCGTDLKSGRKPKKTYEPIDRSWEYRWPFQTRFGVFLGMQVINVFLALFVSQATSPFLAFINLVMQGVFQAFLLGSYETLRVKRTTKGQTTITTTWRYCFIPVVPWEVPWKRSQAVSISGTTDVGIFGWLMCIYLTVFMCVVPGIVFWYMFIRPERFDIVLCDVYGSTNDAIFRTTTWDEADEIMDVIKDATGLANQSEMGKRHLDAPIPPAEVPDRSAPLTRKRSRARDEDDDDDWDDENERPSRRRRR